jgi:hypothetical protein
LQSNSAAAAFVAAMQQLQQLSLEWLGSTSIDILVDLPGCMHSCLSAICLLLLLLLAVAAGHKCPPSHQDDA